MTDIQNQEFSQDISSGLQRFGASVQPIIHRISEIAQALAPHLEALAANLQGFSRYNAFIDSVSATGWLPYHTVPIILVEESSGDVGFLDRRIAEFYERNWNCIRQDIEERMVKYEITEETKATFRETLDAHAIGHYRCVCRVLFPAIEREFRVRFFDGAAGPIPSKKMLSALTDHRHLEDLLPKEAYGWILLGRLLRHLYERVDDENVTRIRVDHVPNRHASLHGLVSYSTHKNSVNMIVMADYIFQILAVSARSRSQID